MRFEDRRICSDWTGTTAWCRSMATVGTSQQLILQDGAYLWPDGDGPEYGKIWFFAYMTSKDSTEVHPVANVWFDDLIVSTSYIEDPRDP